MLRSSASEWINTIRGASALGAARSVNAMVTPSDVVNAPSCVMGGIGSHGFGRRRAERNAPRVITIEPGRVLVPALHPGVGARDGLNARRARLAVRFVLFERAREVVAFGRGQAAREDRRIL